MDKTLRRIRMNIYNILQEHRKMIFIWGLLLVLGFYAVSRLYEETYVWQSTVLNTILQPTSRRQCDLGYNATKYALSAGLSKPLKVGILMLYSSASEGAWNPVLMRRVENNRKQFCDIHHCDVINANHLIDRSRPTAWSKFIAAKNYLASYDFLFYLDMDIVIMNMNVSYTKFIEYATSEGNKRGPDVGNNIDFIMAQDWSGANTGAWLIRNSTWSRQFLDDAWRLGASMVTPKSPDGISYPFQYEQRVFHYMLATEKWTSRGLPKYQHYQDVRSHFVILPQCAMNSYSIHPLEYRANREVSQYVRGDFLIHFPGKSPAAKEALMMHYLDKVHN